MKRTICIILTIMLAAGMLSACAQAAGNESAGEPTIITYYRPVLQRNNISGWENALWIQEIEKKMNVKFVFQGPAVDYDQSVNIMLASNDYPDLLFFDFNNKYNGGISAAVQDGVVFSVNSDEYRALLPNYINLLNSNDKFRKTQTLDDGSIVSFQHFKESYKVGAWAGHSIRKDWLDTVGLEVPTTIDELYVALTAFKEQDANGNGDPNDEIPLTDDNGLRTIKYLAPAWGMLYNQPFIDSETGKINYWTQYKSGQAFTDYVTTLNKWYAEGLIDLDFATQDHSAKEAKITSDKAGFNFAYTADYTGRTAALEAFNPDLVGKVNVYGMVPLIGPGGKPYTGNYDHISVPGIGTVITSRAVKDGIIETVLKVLDYMYSEEGSNIISWGVEGVSYTINANGEKEWTDAVKNDPEFAFLDKIFEYALPTQGDWPKIQMYDAFRSCEVTNVLNETAHENYWKGDTGLLAQDVIMTTEEAEEYNRIKTDVDTAVNEFIINAIIGTRPISDIPVFLKQVTNMGIDRAMEIRQQAFDRFMSK